MLSPLATATGTLVSAHMAQHVVLVALTPRWLYPSYQGAELWGLYTVDDQRLAGLVMWVPAGAI